MNKKMAIILGLSLFSVLVIILIILAVLHGTKSTTTVSPTPTPVEPLTQSPTHMPRVTINPSITPHPQRELDFEAGSKKMDDEFPWMSNMPIHTDRYFVFFDTNKKKITAELYVTPDQEDNARTEIVSRLKILKVPLDKYPIEFIPKPQ